MRFSEQLGVSLLNCDDLVFRGRFRKYMPAKKIYLACWLTVGKRKVSENFTATFAITRQFNERPRKSMITNFTP